MSGLLPRTTPTTQNGSFDALNVKTLNVSVAAYINSLVTTTINVANLVIGALTTGTINGAPDLNIVAGAATVNGAAISTAAAVETLTNKTIDSGSNTLTITSAPLAAANINSVLNQAVTSTSSPTFATANITNQVNVQTTNTSGVLINQALNLASNTNGLAIQSNAVTKLFIGHNQSLDLCYISAGPGLRLLTNGSERIRIDLAGLVSVLSGAGVSMHIGAATSYTFLGAGDLGYAFGAGNWFTSAAAGDICLRASNTARKLNLGVGSGIAQLQIANTAATITVPCTFSAAPVISSITNTGTLTLPTTTGVVALLSDITSALSTYVTLGTAQAITGVKTMTSPVLIGASIKSASPDPEVTLSTNSLAGNRNYVFPNAPNNAAFLMSTGTGQTVSQSLTFSAAPSISSILVGGQTLTLPSATDTVLARATTDTLTNKTIGSTNNTITITSGALAAANINTVLDQTVSTTSSPQFNTINYATQARSVPFAGNQSAGTAQTAYYVFTPALNTAAAVYIMMSSRCLNGTQTGYTSYLYDYKLVNNGGVLAVTNGSNSSRSDTALAGAYNGKTTVTTAVLGADIQFRIGNTLASGNMFYSGLAEVMFI